MIREDITAPWPDYIRETINANPPLPHAEQVSLCRRWQQQGDEQARNQLATSTLRFIASIALTYRGRGMELPDLIQEGTLGCMQAIDRFDETRGFKFISYAVHWIRQAIQKALADQVSTIRHPLSRVQANAKAIELRNDLEQQHERQVDLLESAAVARQQCWDSGRQYPRYDHGLGELFFSLDAPVVEGDGNGLRAEYCSELASDEDSGMAAEEHEFKEIIRELLAEVSGRDRYIVDRYYGLTEAPPMTLEEIGAELNLTRERVRQLKAMTMDKIQKKINGYREELHALLAD